MAAETARPGSAAPVTSYESAIVMNEVRAKSAAVLSFAASSGSPSARITAAGPAAIAGSHSAASSPAISSSRSFGRTEARWRATAAPRTVCAPVSTTTPSEPDHESRIDRSGTA
ncbi:hypothetical protein GCM10018792_77690 [Streptomyces rubradiris]|nr:hypothetical protein GCM10018792_77690 [Streptomyces rubradiris]